jgi:hypothetical protein
VTVQGFGELDLEARLNIVWAVGGIVVCAVITYATLRTLKTHKRLEKRMGLGEEDTP